MLITRDAERWMRAMAALSCAVVFAACVSSSTGKTRATPSPSASGTIVEMGRSAETRQGNRVTVHAYESPIASKDQAADVVLAAADIEACAGTNTTQTAVARTLFSVEAANKNLLPSVDPVKKPALPTGLLQQNHCTRGWVTFSLPKGQDAVYVVLTSSTVVKWRIP